MRRKYLLIGLTAAALIAVVCLFFYFGNGQTAAQNSPTNPENPGDLLVVPESPIGILGMMSALAAALGMFAMKKKRM